MAILTGKDLKGYGFVVISAMIKTSKGMFNTPRSAE